MDPGTRRRIPRVWRYLVPLLAFTLSAVLVGVAWRANRATRTATPEGPVVQVATDSFAGCTECHRDLDKVFKEGRAPTLLYTHEEHFATGVSDCSVCHPGNTHEPDTINKPTMTRCFTCHGLTSVAIAPGECSTCHPPGMPETPETHQVERWLPTAHGERAKTDRFECLTCHRERFCTSCHGLELPHPQGWEDVPHAEAFFELGSKNCAQCHPRAPEVRDDCDTCHHPEGPQRVGWRAAHAQAVTDRGAEDCFECHDPSTCVTCHLQGRETFAADRDRLAAAQAEG